MQFLINCECNFSCKRQANDRVNPAAKRSKLQVGMENNLQSKSENFTLTLRDCFDDQSS